MYNEWMSLLERMQQAMQLSMQLYCTFLYGQNFMTCHLIDIHLFGIPAFKFTWRIFSDADDGTGTFRSLFCVDVAVDTENAEMKVLM